MTKEHLEIIRAEVEKYLADGGSLQKSVKSLPFYNLMRYFSERDGDKFSVANIMDTLGYGDEADREYVRYCNMLSVLEQHADKDGYVDSVKDRKDGDKTAKLREFAKNLGCTPSDYLILMTPYRFREASIHLDYVGAVAREVAEKYPEGVAGAVRRENLQLYDRMRGIKTAGTADGTSMKDVTEYLGIKSHKSQTRTFSDKPSDIGDIQDVVTKYKAGFSDGTISNLSSNPGLYSELVRYAMRLGCSVRDVCDMYDLPARGTRHSAERLGRMDVDAEKREAELRAKSAEIVSREGLESPSNSREAYYFNKNLAKKVIEELYNEHVSGVDGEEMI